MKSIFRIAVLIVLLLNGACDILLTPELPTPSPEVTETATTVPPTVIASPEPTLSQVTPDAATVRIWVPPEFDPNSGTRAANLLLARLNAFVRRRPGVSVEVRVKAVSGPGGLMDSLSATSAAAPLAMPDLIALPDDYLETAVLKGLLQSYDGLTDAMDDSDWYPYALELSQLQENIYGLPFAGDVQAVVYRTNLIETPPENWAMTYESQSPLVFAAADPQAIFTMLQYQSQGGPIRDDEGRPYLDQEILTSVLTFYQEAELVEVMPYWLTQYQDDEQIWTTFEEGRAGMVVTWFSNYFSSEEEEIAVAAIPTSDGDLFTLARGWVWALSTNKDARKEISIELAEFLTESIFLASWNQAAGYLPPRPSSVRTWNDDDLKILASQIANSAILMPSSDIVTSLGGPLQQATVQVLRNKENLLARHKMRLPA